MKDDPTYGSAPCHHTRDRREADLVRALEDAWTVLDHLYSEGDSLPVAIHDAATRSRLARERLIPAAGRGSRGAAR